MLKHKQQIINWPDTDACPSRKVIYVDLSGKNNELSCSLEEWQLISTTSLAEASDVLKTQRFYVGLVRLGSMNKGEKVALELFFEQMPSLYWIALVDASHMKVQAVCRLIYKYFFDYYTLPLPDNGYFLSATLGHTHGLSQLQYIETKKEKFQEEYQMVGGSDAITMVFEQIRKVASVDAAVLITGSSGTGKELIVRAIHQCSRRKNGPFIAVNCGALPHSLVQAELFGYEKGAFTGAMSRKIGRIEAAAGGTLFLDEIGDLPLEQQVNLLRFLQDETIERLGGTETLHIDTRVVAATHVDIKAAVSRGEFREDLYYRLNVLSIHMPDLKDRGGDIELLANYSFKKFTQDQHCRLRGFSRKAIIAMNNYDWPGNIRELINRVQKAIVMSDNRLITPSDLGLEEIEEDRSPLSLEQARQTAEKKAVKNCLLYTRYNVSSAARMLGVSRMTLYRLMNKYQLQDGDD